MHLPSIPYPVFRIVLYGWIGLAIVVFFILLRVTAPYGRHSSEKWGPQISNRWGWLIMELPVLLMILLCVASSGRKIDMIVTMMIGLFCIHYLNRCIIFPFRLHTQRKKMPVIIVASAVFFNLINGFSLGYYFTRFSLYPATWYRDPRFIAGLLMFVPGMYINWKADNRLIRLRKPGETGYQIPRGWLFESLSCPNLFGELLEWAGFAVLCWNLPALAFFIWTAANLIPRAISHHKWYRNQFIDYPENRYAIIPFLV